MSRARRLALAAILGGTPAAIFLVQANTPAQGQICVQAHAGLDGPQPLTGPCGIQTPPELGEYDICTGGGYEHKDDIPGTWTWVEARACVTSVTVLP